MKKLTLFTSISLLFMLSASLQAQENKYEFKDDIDIKVTSVKDQHRSGTCWSFASVSYLEAELLRQGKGEYDLSEMFLVRNCFTEKAGKYVRMHGKTNFGGGGLAHDLIMVWKNYGLVPEEAYQGLEYGTDGHVHGEMESVLTGYIEQVIKNRNRKLSSAWLNGFNGILDAYLGEYPSSFSYKGKEYTPRSFADGFGLDPDDYITIGSFTHHPFYQPFILEIPDNWGWNEIENVKLDEMIAVLDNALEKGYTVCWDADVSEKSFYWNEGYATLPFLQPEDLANSERGRFSDLTDEEKMARLKELRDSHKEQVVSQEIRQQWFDDYTTTDDHLMHITGRAFDKDGNKFYKVKNSWGTGPHVYEGYFYCSESFMRAKTLFFMVHKDVIPKDIASRLGE